MMRMETEDAPTGKSDRTQSPASRGWLARAAASVEDRFLVPCYASPRRGVWISAHGALALPFLVWGHERFGVVRVDGEPVRATAIGPSGRIRGLLGPWCDDPLPALERGTRRCLWHPADCVRRPAQFRVAEIHRWAIPRFRRAGWMIVPDSVRWEGELDSLPPRNPGRSLRSDLTKVRRGDFSIEQAGDPADWDRFFSGMVRPAAIRRFGEDAWVPSARTMRAFSRSGILLLLRSAGVCVAGICVIPRGASLWAPVLGVAKPGSGGTPRGIGAALYKLTFDWARAQGFAGMDMGRTSPRLDDPIAWYKRKWGLRPVPDPLAHRLAVWIDPDSSVLRRAVARSPVLAEGPAGLIEFPEGA